jgi:hypothetical protein
MLEARALLVTMQTSDCGVIFETLQPRMPAQRASILHKTE